MPTESSEEAAERCFFAQQCLDFVHFRKHSVGALTWAPDLVRFLLAFSLADVGIRAIGSQLLMLQALLRHDPGLLRCVGMFGVVGAILVNALPREQELLIDILLHTIGQYGATTMPLSRLEAGLLVFPVVQVSNAA